MSAIATTFFAYGLTAIVSIGVAVLIKLMTSVLSSMQESKAQGALKPSSPPVVAAVAVPAAGSDEAVIAVIAAAVAASMGSGARIVRIEGEKRSVLWTASGRLVHQTSHVLTRRPLTRATSAR